MNTNLIRQIQDIQHQAYKLMKGSSDSEAIDEFARYNMEMKAYLIKHIHDEEIRSEIAAIPNVHDVQVDPVITSFFLTVSLAIVTLGVSVFIIAYLSNMRMSELMLQKVNECRSKYANIEFLMKSRA
jgi:hypothetical protein